MIADRTGATTLLASVASFSYHGDAGPALLGVEMAAAPGTLTAVLGGSGSGKSTLGRLLGAWVLGGRDGTLAGSLQLDVAGVPASSRPLAFTGATDDPRIDPGAWARHVGYVPQDAASMLSAVRETVEEELAFSLENRGVPRAEMVRTVAGIARRTGLGGLLHRDPATLSGGELRRLAVGCAVVDGPGVLVLDEPLESLDQAGVRTVMELVHAELALGTAIVVLSQYADALTRAAERWLVLKDGEVTAAGPPGQILQGHALAESGVVITSPEPDAEPEPEPAAESGLPMPAPPAALPLPVVEARAGTAAALELANVAFGFGRLPGSVPSEDSMLLQDVNLQVMPGEVLAVTGPNGAGKSTLLRLLNGLHRPLRGDVRVAGESIAAVPTGLVARRLGLLFQHSHDQLFERTALREVLFGLDRLFAVGAPERARAALAAVGLEASENAHPHELPASGQRLLALATVLARDPSVLALDEPTVALDAHGLERLTAAVSAAAGRGAAVVLVTHDIGFAKAHAHRLLRLDGGRLLPH
ncbi:putative ABC transporter ATP-binding protein [Arthrobacter globiformis NBRC 12137]|uniref:Putative ABC transporter ATP-binding protein n=1 Tax=Arthrobacter globiformis (strain ATCC 8010 / DSM 20124 / JCM 1332 / NBRC 12137 / NCIMB 8907 / NRRL B-2979 / 168) TaxID=1077972 RepID=H0QM06_ARTG1|nr:ABC transporter ATP-binding protein [Arthrobacter globiformis]GAB13857.1 putative ABC transporter ATP-binding protein [Arthrobacter globiformis NBRC 12137]